MTIGRLLVKMVADDDELHKALKRSVQRVEDFDSAVGNLGASLTRSLSAPLLLLGGATLRATAEMDSLMKELEAMTGSAEEASRQLAVLTEAAKLPGIELTNAIKTAAVLQGIGFTAGGAERAIRGIGKAVAASGGGAEEFRNVARQFRQVASLGRLMGEELNVIVENAPAAAKALQTAFGTTSAEQIRKLGLTTEEFFQKLLAGFESLPTVTGSLKNSFENLWVAIKQALGFSTQEDLQNIQILVDNITDSVERASLAWRSLPVETKRTIYGIAAALVALGPTISILTKLVGGLALLRTATAVIAGKGGMVAALAALPGAINPVVLALLALAGAFAFFKGKKLLNDIFDAKAVASFKQDLAGLSVDQLGVEFQRQARALQEAIEARDKLQKGLPTSGATRAAMRAQGQDPEGMEKKYANQVDLVEELTRRVQQTAEAWGQARTEFTKYEALMDPDMGNRKGLESGKEWWEKEVERLKLVSQFLGQMEPKTTAWADAQALVVKELTQIEALNERFAGVISEEANALRQAAIDLRDALGLNIPNITPEAAGGFQKPELAKQLRPVILPPEAFNPWEEALLRTTEDLIYFGQEVRVGAAQLAQQFTRPKDTGRAALQMMGEAALGVAQQLSPLGLVAHALSVVMELLQPAIDGLLYPITILAEALMPALNATLKLLFPLIKWLAIGLTFLGQVFFTVSGWITKAVGLLIRGLGRFLDSLPGVGDFGLRKAGQALINHGDAALKTAEELKRARKELMDLTFEDAIDRAAEGLDKLTESVLNSVEGYKVEARRWDAIEDMRRPVSDVPRRRGGGGDQGGDTGPTEPRRREPQPVHFGDVNITTTGDGTTTYREFYNELDRRTRGASAEARAIFLALPAPIG